MYDNISRFWYWHNKSQEVLSFVEHVRFQFYLDLLYVVKFVHLFVTILFGYNDSS
jgi:hypothetical protein